MNKEFVTYEQALAFKELEFDEKCFTSYDDEQRLRNPFDCKEDYEFNISYIEDSNCFCENSKLSNRFISAPLYQQAFRWFRDKHNLCGEVYTVNMGAIDYTFQIRDLYSEDIKHNNFEAYTGGYVGTFLTYEEAEQACLDKLIELVKK